MTDKNSSYFSKDSESEYCKKTYPESIPSFTTPMPLRNYPYPCPDDPNLGPASQ